MSGFSFYSYSIFFIVFIFLIFIMFFISIRDDLRWSLLVFRLTFFIISPIPFCYPLPSFHSNSASDISLASKTSSTSPACHLPPIQWLLGLGLLSLTKDIIDIIDIVIYHACLSMMSSFLPMNRKTHQWNTMCRELHGNSGPGQWITTSKLVGFQKYPAMDKMESCQRALRLRNLGAILYCLDTLNMRHCTCLFQITSFHKHTSLISMIQGTLASIANSGRWGRRSVDSAASCCWSANIACWSTLIAFQIIGSFSSNLIRFKEVKGIQTHTQREKMVKLHIRNAQNDHKDASRLSQMCFV